MKKEEKLNQFWKYVLLIVGGILILVPLLVTVFSSFKTTKDIMNHFFSLPNPFTLSNYERLISDGIGGYFWNSAVITVLSLIVVAFFIPAAAYSIARNMSKKKAFAIMYSLLILGISGDYDSYHSYDEQTRPGKYVGVGTTLSNLCNSTDSLLVCWLY